MQRMAGLQHGLWSSNDWLHFIQSREGERKDECNLKNSRVQCEEGSDVLKWLAHTKAIRWKKRWRATLRGLLIWECWACSQSSLVNVVLRELVVSNGEHTNINTISLSCTYNLLQIWNIWVVMCDWSELQPISLAHKHRESDILISWVFTSCPSCFINAGHLNSQ